MMKRYTFEGLEYFLTFPENFNEDSKYPVIILLHGAGSRGHDLEMLKSNPYFDKSCVALTLPVILVTPQCNRDTWFDHFEELKRLTKSIYNADFTDKKKFYCMGASMGGYATWQLAMSCPELFAAIVPICGGGMYWNAARLKNVPVWAFHGECDNVVYAEESRKMVDNVNISGGNARLTIYENCDHNAWSRTYANPEVFSWLLAQSKGEGYTESNGFDDAEIYG